MLAFLPHSDSPSDYDNIRVNGMWYQEWQGGYHDILNRGYPRPRYKTTILAELHSPITPDFLHGGSTDVPFLVSPRSKALMRHHSLTGFRFSKVEIAKIATKGARKGKPKCGEPEDQIMKAKDQAVNVDRPTLYAVRVVGRLEIIPEYSTGYCPVTGYVCPFDLPKTGRMPDLWRPTINGRTFAAWVYCSKRFRDVITRHALSNIGFEPFDEHMAEVRRDNEVDMVEMRQSAHV